MPERKPAVPVLPSAFLPLSQTVTLSIFKLDGGDLLVDDVRQL
jgi:hypothetical protein